MVKVNIKYEKSLLSEEFITQAFFLSKQNIEQPLNIALAAIHYDLMVSPTSRK